MHDVASNLVRLREAIADAAVRAGRGADDIRLLAVSKMHAFESVEAALRAGQRAFGESTIQEALPKIAHFAGRGAEWHFIGHLQSNKARLIPGNFLWIHSLDSLKLAQRLSRFAREQRAPINALIEVNVTADPRKHGIAPTAVIPLVDRLLEEDLAGVALRGLMAIGPHAAPEADIRRAYARLRQLRDECVARFALDNFTELSMGMSGDFVPAIAEGATIVRVGTAIFGERDYGVARTPAS